MSTPQITYRCFQFGDGLFETIRAENGALQGFDFHWARLKRGAEVLGIRLPSKRILQRRCESLAKPPQLEDGEAPQPQIMAVKLQVTRGNSMGGYAAAEAQPANIYVSARPVRLNPQFWEGGIALRWCQQPLAIQPVLAGLKHCNRLEQVLARREWQQAFQEGLMCDSEGTVVEGTASNLFWFDGTVWKTPLLDRCGVAGTMRARVMAWMAEQGIECREVRASVDEVNRAQSLFVCNAIVGVWPVATLEMEAKKTEAKKRAPLMDTLVAEFSPVEQSNDA